MARRQNKPWERTRGRQKPTRRLKRFLIVCEDEKSGHDYLRSFPYDSDKFEFVTEGGCGNTLSVLERGLELREQAKKKKTPFAKVFCVIDRDDHPKERYQQCFDVAYKYNDVEVIWINEAFELWYVLHFEYLNVATHRHDLAKKCGRLMGRKYNKSDTSVYAKLEDKIETAKINAEKLEKLWKGNPKPYLQNPSTNLQDLITILQDPTSHRDA